MQQLIHTERILHSLKFLHFCRPTRPRLKNIDRSSAQHLEVTVGDLTVIITDFKEKAKPSSTSATSSSAASATDHHSQNGSSSENTEKGLSRSSSPRGEGSSVNGEFHWVTPLVTSLSFHPRYHLQVHMSPAEHTASTAVQYWLQQFLVFFISSISSGSFIRMCGLRVAGASHSPSLLSLRFSITLESYI